MNSTARARGRTAGGNLPAEVTSFVGRRREITTTKRLLAESRVVTLTGPGGIGKSRLAMRVAANMRKAFRDKTWQVELGELDDPDMLAGTIIEQLNVPETTGGSELDDLVEYFRERELLLVLDNCEHLVQACALLVDSLVRACPGLRVLATSRHSLGTAGESTLVVPPLQTPDPEHLPAPEAHEQYAAVRLFEERARAVLPDFEVTSRNAPVLMRLCHRLDGNPLAIELAVVRLRSLTLEQLEERLTQRYDLLTEGRRSAPQRQRTLRALIDWSYDLCTEQDRRAWQHASVFAGSFDLEAAEYVIGGTVDRAEIAGLVHSLVDKSILLRDQDAGSGRYRLPHALREYGLEKLEVAGKRAQAESRHRRWYAGLVERFAAEWVGSEQPSWVQRMRAEQANLRAALRSATAGTEPREHPRGTLLLAIRLARYWEIRGLHGEARHWLDRAMAVSPLDSAPAEHAAALRLSAWFALLQGDLSTADELLDQAGEPTDRHDKEAGQGYLRQLRGMMMLLSGRPDEAARLSAIALGMFRTHAVVEGELFSLLGLGLARGASTDHQGGLELLEECRRATARRGEVFWRAWALWAMGFLEVTGDRPDRADSALKEALHLQRKLDNRLAIAFVLDTLAWVAERRGDKKRAATLFGAAAGAWEAVRSTPSFYGRFGTERENRLSRVREALGEPAYADSFDRGYGWPTDGAIDFALEVKKRARTESRDNVHPMPLTGREREIAQLVAQGRTNKEIAEQLVIALRTVEGHVQHILTKLDFTSRAQIAGWVAGQQREQSE